MPTRAAVIAGLVCWLGMSAAPSSVAEFRLERLHGPSVTVSTFEITDEALLVGEAREQIPLSDVISVGKTEVRDDWSQRSSLLWLTNGDRLNALPLEIDDDTLTMRWTQFPMHEAPAIPLEFVMEFTLSMPESIEGRNQFHRKLATETAEADVAWLTSGDRVTGEYSGYSSGEFLLRTPAAQLPILRENLQALRFNPQLTAQPKQPGRRYLLTFSDGSRFTVSRVRTARQAVVFTTVFGVEGTLPADALVDVQVFSPRIQALSERAPVDVKQTPYLGGRWPWMKNRNVLQGPLQVRGREYGFGLGVHSQTSLTFAVEPKDREFHAIVGLDDLADGGGHVVFQVAVDDRVVWSRPGVTGTSEPLAIPPVHLRGSRRLTLTVDFGEQGDTRDYANWCLPLILRDE